MGIGKSVAIHSMLEFLQFIMYMNDYKKNKFLRI